ncbi:hypothetical protein SAMN05421810_101100 [Amycolatopsis arida]|uniref:Uncharacterized protein n=1 Tax=Amycolatopsis arida TaxID=587909 RepID=A0A1I5KD54_9PSEU|nr:hypothetical protein [Amycolatopsis arida]TDX96996.1 hypothetical protein CLV69_10298 [Amycolatopsis arida]SFO83002.1 hypothetical protein SAMN05421810_101100 [Amycolatopsis arida]
MSKHIICKVCDRALNRYVDDDGVTYIHTFNDPTNHEPVPVEAPPDWRGRCDFCSAEKPEFLLPARDFRVPHHDNEMSIGDWAACAFCAMLIDSNRWNELARRAAAGHEKLHGVPPDELRITFVRALYGELRKHISGSLRPIGGEQ